MAKIKCFSSRFAVVIVQNIEAKCSVQNDDVDGAVPSGDAPTTSVWSTNLLPTKFPLILEIWRYFNEALVKYNIRVDQK